MLDELRLRYQGEIEIEYVPLGHGISLQLDEYYYFSILDNMVSNVIKFNDQVHRTIRLTWEKGQMNTVLKLRTMEAGLPRQIGTRCLQNSIVVGLGLASRGSDWDYIM